MCRAPLVRGILQARILEWVVISFPRGSSWLRDQTQVSCIAGRFFSVWATGEAWTLDLFLGMAEPWMHMYWGEYEYSSLVSREIEREESRQRPKGLTQHGAHNHKHQGMSDTGSPWHFPQSDLPALIFGNLALLERKQNRDPFSLFSSGPVSHYSTPYHTHFYQYISLL